MNTQCVIREINAGDNQFVLVSDVLRRVGKLVPGEQVYLGKFNGRAEKCGPYGSDSRVVCLPVGDLEIVNASSTGQLVLN